MTFKTQPCLFWILLALSSSAKHQARYALSADCSQRYWAQMNSGGECIDFWSPLSHPTIWTSLLFVLSDPVWWAVWRSSIHKTEFFIWNHYSSCEVVPQTELSSCKKNLSPLVLSPTLTSPCLLSCLSLSYWSTDTLFFLVFLPRWPSITPNDKYTKTSEETERQAEIKCRERQR